MVHRTDTSTVSTVHTNALYKGKAAEGPSGTLGDHKVTLGKGQFPPATDTKAGTASKGFFASIASWFKDAFAKLGDKLNPPPENHTYSAAKDQNISKGNKQTIVFENVNYRVTRDFDQDKQHVRSYAKGIVAEMNGTFSETTFMRANELRQQLTTDDGTPFAVPYKSPSGRDLSTPVYGDMDKKTSPIFNHYASSMMRDINSFTKRVDDKASVITQTQADKAAKLSPSGSSSDDAKRAAANKAVADFDALMSTLFGGSDAASIDEAVASTPSKFRELLTTAHEEIESEGLAQNMDQGDIDRMKQLSTVNFVALRTFNPILTLAVAKADASGDTEKANSLKNTSKLLQNIFNGVDPTTSQKEPVTAEFREAFGTRFTDWSQAVASYMEKLPA